MKQKLFLGALLLGALTLNSCVDDTESASVTAVRQAKVEQLKSLADLNKANAESALILANAEKAAKEAQAELARAEAALRQAETEYQNAQTEKAKARAEEALANAQVAKAQAEAQLQTIAGQLEIDLLQQKTNLLQAKKDYEDAIKRGEREKIAELTTLFNTYDQASQALVSAKHSLANNKISLAQLESNLTTVQENVQKQIANYNDNIARYEGFIASDKAWIETYKKYEGKTDEAKAAYNKAERENFELEKAQATAQNVYNKAYTAKNEASSTLSNSKYVKTIAYFTRNEEAANDYKTYNVINGIYIRSDWSGNKPEYKAYVRTETGYNEIALFYGVSTDWDANKIEYTLASTQGPQYLYYAQVECNYNLIAGGFDAYFKAAQASIAADQGKALNDAKAAYTVAETAQKAAVAAQTAAQTALKAAEDAVKAAGANATEAQKQAVEDAKRQLEGAKSNVASANTTLEEKADDQKAAQKTLDEINAKLAENKAKYDSLVTLAPENDANIKAMDAAYKTEAEASVNSKVANQAVLDKQSEMQALWAIYTESNTIDQQIKNKEDNIERYNGYIANFKKQIADLENNGTVSAEQAIESLKNTIANQEEKIKVLQKQADAAKAALDEAMKADAPAE